MWFLGFGVEVGSGRSIHLAARQMVASAPILCGSNLGRALGELPGYDACENQVPTDLFTAVRFVLVADSTSPPASKLPSIFWRFTPLGSA